MNRRCPGKNGIVPMSVSAPVVDERIGRAVRVLLAIAGATALLWLRDALPRPAEVQATLRSVETFADASADQVTLLRQQLDQARQPFTADRVAELRGRAEQFARLARARPLDADALEALRDALDAAGRGTSSLASLARPELIAALDRTLEQAADWANRLGPAGLRASQELDQATRGLETTAKGLVELTHAAQLDFQPLQVVHDALDHLDRGLQATRDALDPQAIHTLQDALNSARKVSDNAHAITRDLAARWIPLMGNPWRDRLTNAAQGLCEISASLDAMRTELDARARLVPRIHESLEAARVVVAQTRGSLAVALAQRERVEPLARALPDQAARIAKVLPKLTGEITDLLRQSHRLIELAEALQEGREPLRKAADGLPRIQAGLKGSSAVLIASARRLDDLLVHRDEFETAQDAWERLAADFAESLPDQSIQLRERLDLLESSLTQTHISLEHLRRVTPATLNSADAFLQRLGWILLGCAGLLSSEALRQLVLIGRATRTRYARPVEPTA